MDFWLLGNLGSLDWTQDGIAFGVVLVAGTLLATYGRELNILQLGPDVARASASTRERCECACCCSPR